MRCEIARIPFKNEIHPKLERIFEDFDSRDGQAFQGKGYVNTFEKLLKKHPEAFSDTIVLRLEDGSALKYTIHDNRKTGGTWIIVKTTEEEIIV